MNLGFSEMMFLFLLGLLLFGPKKLPEIGRQIGKALAEFKRASNELQAQLNEEVRKLELESAVSTIQETIQPIGQIARGEYLAAVTSVSGTAPAPAAPAIAPAASTEAVSGEVAPAAQAAALPEKPTAQVTNA